MGVISWLNEEWAKAKARLAARRAEVAASKVPLRAPWPTFAERMTVLFDQFRTEKIDLEDYADGVEIEQQRCEEAIMLHRQCQFDMDPAQFEADLEELDQELGECRWRLWWIAHQSRKAGIRQNEFPASGHWARFDYVNHHGMTSRRSITLWEKQGNYIVGYDHTRNSERRFRQDCIRNWVSG